MIASHSRTFLKLLHQDNSIKVHYLDTSAALNQDDMDVVELSTEELTIGWSFHLA